MNGFFSKRQKESGILHSKFEKKNEVCNFSVEKFDTPMDAFVKNKQLNIISKFKRKCYIFPQKRLKLQCSHVFFFRQELGYTCVFLCEFTKKIR